MKPINVKDLVEQSFQAARALSITAGADADLHRLRHCNLGQGAHIPRLPGSSPVKLELPSIIVNFPYIQVKLGYREECSGMRIRGSGQMK